jgi:hypothetical protein
MSINSSILVLGAGELGMAILRNLAKRASTVTNTTITVLLRPSAINSIDPKKQNETTELHSLGIKFIPGDLVAASVAELSAIFMPFDTIISCIGFVTGRKVQIKFAQAALEAGIKRYFPWQFGVDYDVIGKGSAQDLFDEQLEVRDLLRSQNRTEWVIISTGMFTSFLFEPSFGVVDVAGGTIHALGSWDTSVTVTTPEDIGLVTAEIVFSEPRITNSIVYTAGDTLTYKRLADTVDAVLGKRLQRVEWTVSELEKELAEDTGNNIKKYRVVIAKGRGVSWDIDRTFNEQKGIKLVSVDEWAHKNLT